MHSRLSPGQRIREVFGGMGSLANSGCYWGPFPDNIHRTIRGSLIAVLVRLGGLIPIGAIVGKAMAMAGMGQPQKDAAGRLHEPEDAAERTDA